MAEGGFDPPNGNGFDGGGNPYSFQKFVKSQPSNSEEEKIAAEHNEQPQRTRREENPFSFKQFLKKDAASSKPKVYSLMVDDISETCGGSRARTLTPDVTTALPDFVQDHFILDSAQDSRQPKTTVNSDERNSFRLTSSLDLHLPVVNQLEHPFPDLTADDGLGLPDEHLDNSSNEINEPLNFDVDECGTISESNNQDGSGLPLSLPDFLSDGPMLNHYPPSDENRPSSDSTSQVECSYCHSVQLAGSSQQISELEELRRIHSNTLQELDNSRALIEGSSSKILKLEKEVVTLKSKEVADTVTLENMVHQVEQNLQITTQRAVKAENTVSKLKQELKTLQTKIASLVSENELLKDGAQSNVIPEDVHTKATNLSTMLSCAATDAETSLKQLLRGVEHLRFLSTVAQNIDKVTDTSTTEDK